MGGQRLRDDDTAGTGGREVTGAATRIQFFVPGIPAPGGSKKYMGTYLKGGKRIPLIVDDAKHNASWRDIVAWTARREYRGVPLRGALQVSMEFIMPRPRSHYGKNVLKANAPGLHTVRPDLTKLVRSTEDALKGITWTDDSIIWDQHNTKHYGEIPGVKITITQGGE